jgi:hypothetical protein
LTSRGGLFRFWSDAYCWPAALVPTGTLFVTPVASPGSGQCFANWRWRTFGWNSVNIAIKSVQCSVLLSTTSSAFGPCKYWLLQYSSTANVAII